MRHGRPRFCYHPKVKDNGFCFECHEYLIDGNTALNTAHTKYKKKLKMKEDLKTGRIKSPDLIPLEFLPPKQPADVEPQIYFLYNGDKLQYIGETVALHQRIRTHCLEHRVDFDSFTHIPAPRDPTIRKHLEAKYIATHKPLMNRITKPPGDPDDNTRRDTRNEEVDNLESG